MSAPDESEEAGPARVVPLTAYSVVTQPGGVKIIHRSGRVCITFTGATWLEDVTSLRNQLDELLGDKVRIREEVLLKKPWWRFW